MNGGLHERAQRLLEQERVEGISTGDREWLERHLDVCPACSHQAAALEQALRSLRSVPIAVPPDLASRTQLRVYLRVRDLQERRNGGWAMWTACGVSWAAGIASAPYVWHAFEWLGHAAGLPPLLWEMGFALWWIVPALLAVGALLLDRPDLKSHRAR